MIALMTRDCLDCGKPIAEKRLAAVPQAVYCIKCQVHHDEPLVGFVRHSEREDEIDAANLEILPRRKMIWDSVDKLPED